MHKLIQICFVITLIYAVAVVTAQETQSRLPVSMSFGYEHPTSSSSMEESDTPIIARTPGMSSNSNQRSYQSSYEDSEVPLKDTTNEVDRNEQGTIDPSMDSTRTRSSGSSHTNYEQLNDETITLAIKNTTGSNRLNGTDESEPGTSNSTINKRKKLQDRVEEEISTPRHAPRRNTTIHRDQDHNRLKNITEIDKTSEEKNQDKNITNVTFPGGRHGMKNDTTENSAFTPRNGFEWLGFTAALVALLNF